MCDNNGTWDEAWLVELVSKAKRVLDAGSGPQGGVWWRNKPVDTYMLAVDLYFKPPNLPPNSEFLMGDVANFCETSDKHKEYFDLVVADHILEHVDDPARFALAFNRVLAINGLVHVGIPDATMFTDRFYRLIHPDSGGHVSQLTLDSLTDIMISAGFDRVDYRPWPDDWQWFKRCYDWQGRGIKFITQAEIDYIANVFLKELTPEKGYYYGWEIIFAKREEKEIHSIKKPNLSNYSSAITSDSAGLTESSNSALSSNLDEAMEAHYQFTPIEAAQLRWLVYWILRIKQKRSFQWVKVLAKRLGLA
jgi:hypothetical protein